MLSLWSNESISHLYLFFTSLEIIAYKGIFLLSKGNKIIQGNKSDNKTGIYMQKIQKGI